MNKKKQAKTILRYAPVILAITIFLLFFNHIIPQPPSGKIIRARKALSRASHANARHYAPVRYSNAVKMYDSAMHEWKIQNSKFFLKRDFSKLGNMASRSYELAEEAEYFAGIKSSDLDVSLKKQIGYINLLTEQYDSVFNKIPVSKKLIENYTHGKILFTEARLLVKQGNLKAAGETLDKAGLIIDEVTYEIKSFLEKYFEKHEEWLKWRNEAVSISKRKQSALIVIDKLAQNCLVYYAGKPEFSCKIEMGTNWLGHKHQRGDNATPEGRYRVLKKLGSKETKYHKALLIDYPNPDDIRQFDSEKKNGILHENAQIGGLIEIHGEGGRGFHWTNGCIALSNNDMDKVYSIVPSGTPVIIIGSTRKLDELFKLE